MDRCQVQTTCARGHHRLQLAATRPSKRCPMTQLGNACGCERCKVNFAMTCSQMRRGFQDLEQSMTPSRGVREKIRDEDGAPVGGVSEAGHVGTIVRPRPRARPDQVTASGLGIHAYIAGVPSGLSHLAPLSQASRFRIFFSQIFPAKMGCICQIHK